MKSLRHYACIGALVAGMYIASPVFAQSKEKIEEFTEYLKCFANPVDANNNSWREDWIKQWFNKELTPGGNEQINLGLKEKGYFLNNCNDGKYKTYFLQPINNSN